MTEAGPLLAVVDVTKRFGGVAALAGRTFDVGPGTVISSARIFVQGSAMVPFDSAKNRVLVRINARCLDSERCPENPDRLFPRPA